MRTFMMDSKFSFLISIPVSNVGVLELYQHETGILLAFMKNHAISGPSYIHCKLSFTTIPCNNKGIPHALEHLLFNGSKNFPFNDSIDKISNCLCCPYLNAFTSDYLTSFEFECTDQERLHLMMEVWLDHLLNPILTEESFLTEIVHLNSNAEYHGVVYSEVASYERNYDEIISILSKFHTFCGSSSKSKIKLKSTWELYDQLIQKHNGISNGIFSGSGRTIGIKNLNLEELKEFHSNYYKLNNLLVFISGNNDLNYNGIFEVIESFIDTNNLNLNSEVNKKQRKSRSSEIKEIIYDRKICFEEDFDDEFLPWNLEIPFPSEEEDLGSISFTWKYGSFLNLKEMVSVSVILHYLCNGNDSPLIKELVEKKSICSDIDMFCNNEKHRYHQLLLQGVESNDFEKAIVLFKNIVSEYHNGEREFILNDIKCKIEGLYFGHLISLENRTVDTVHQQLSNFFNYSLSNDLNKLEEFINLQKCLQELLKENISYWKNIFNNSFKIEKMNCLEFIPSKKLSKQVTKQFKSERKQRLKENNKLFFQNIKEKLEGAISLNKQRSIPSHILDRFNIPFDLKKIKFNKATILTNLEYNEEKLKNSNQGDDITFKKQRLEPELTSNCLYFYLINPNTEFVNSHLRINIDNNLLPVDKLLMSFLIELLFQTSVKIFNPNNYRINEKYFDLKKNKDFLPNINWNDDEIINYDEFDKILNTFCIDYNAEFGDGWILDSTTIPNQIKIYWTVPKEYFEFSSILISSGIYGMKITAERISVTARTLYGTINEMKLNEDDLINCISNSLCYGKNSIFNIANIPNFENICKKMIKEPERYVKDLERIHKLLIQPFRNDSSDLNQENHFFSLFVVGPEETSTLNVQKYFTVLTNNNSDLSINNKIKNKHLPWEIFSMALPLKLGIEFNMNDIEQSNIINKYGNYIFVQIPSSPTACFIQSINLNNFGNYFPMKTHFYNPDIPPLLVLSNYLWDPCSLFFQAIRGNGLAYSGSIDVCMSTGQLSNCVYESTSIGQSLIKTWEIFREISLSEDELSYEIKTNNKIPPFYDQLYTNLNLDEAKRIASFKFISKHKKISSWSKQLSFDLNVGITPNFDKFIVDQICNVTLKDIKRVAQKYLRLFLPNNYINNKPSSCIACCGGQESAIDLQESLKKFPEIKFKTISLIDFSKQLNRNIK